MKRVVEFKILDGGYSFVENERELFNIDKTNLYFDAKKFYQNFFANGQDYSDIELIGAADMDKKATHVFMTVRQLIAEICVRLKEEFTEEIGNGYVSEKEMTEE